MGYLNIPYNITCICFPLTAYKTMTAVDLVMPEVVEALTRVGI